MGKYEPLAEHLRRQLGDEWSAGFAEVEKVLGFSLPPSARAYREWWANQRGGGHSQKHGWQNAGWQVWKVDLAREQVTFRRAAPQPAPVPGGETEAGLIERAAELLGVSDRGEIVREALKALIQREAARRLASLGGTMPNFRAPPRRRFG